MRSQSVVQQFKITKKKKREGGRDTWCRSCRLEDSELAVEGCIGFIASVDQRGAASAIDEDWAAPLLLGCTAVTGLCRYDWRLTKLQRIGGFHRFEGLRLAACEF
ncbi:hypothetical protein F0562_017127 [Nyssa sinensis]|uniref:Uncharacterized protein n=1 Tax=Nyssa sinensis TaxID=561372 RepID=A0A5J4ZEU9_9ASTE|nr:hypothetical protein F0562_017127 [Nyssa sinensis]